MKELKDLAELVKQTRTMQNEYFKAARGGRSTRDELLKASKILEKTLDSRVNEILNPGKDQPEGGLKQIDLF